MSVRDCALDQKAPVWPGFRIGFALVVASLMSATAAADAADTPRSSSPPRLDPPFGDGMVLQRGIPVCLTGTAAAGESVLVRMSRHVTSTRARSDGRFRACLPPLRRSSRPGRIRVRGRKLLVWGLTAPGPLLFYLGHPGHRDTGGSNSNRYQESARDIIRTE